jgi:hypothetical protein
MGRFLPVLTVSNVSVATGGGYRQHGLVLTSLFPRRMARWMDQAGSQPNASSCTSAQVERDTGIPADSVMNIVDGIPTAEEFSRASRTARRLDGGKGQQDSYDWISTVRLAASSRASSLPQVSLFR